MKILVAGLGQVGGALALCLHEDGYEVTGLRRRQSASAFPTVLADITQQDSLTRLQEPVQAVVYVMTPAQRTELGYRQIYLEGLHNLSQRLAAMSCHPKWFFVSSTSVYEQNQGEWVDESSPTLPSQSNGRVLLEAENWVISRHGTVLRFAGIYGPERFRLIKSVVSGKPVQTLPPYYTNRVHEEDCVGMLKWLIDRYHSGQPLASLYLGCDDDPAPVWEVHSWLAEQLDCTPVASDKLDSETVDSARPTQNKRCRNDKIKMLGYQLRYPSFRDGYPETIRRWQAERNRSN